MNKFTTILLVILGFCVVGLFYSAISQSQSNGELRFNEKLKVNGEGEIYYENNNIIWSEADVSSLTINPELILNRTWDWEIKLICNSTDKIIFYIEYENYEINYTLQTLCAELEEETA